MKNLIDFVQCFSSISILLSVYLMHQNTMQPLFGIVMIVAASFHSLRVWPLALNRALKKLACLFYCSFTQKQLSSGNIFNVTAYMVHHIPIESITGIMSLLRWDWTVCGWIDYHGLVLVRYGIWDFYARYDLVVWYFRYRYFDMMSYDSSISIISASIFLIYWWKWWRKTSKLVIIFSIIQ